MERLERFRAAMSRIPLARLRWYVVAGAVPPLLLKLYLAATTRGTDDVVIFGQFARAVRAYGPIGIYGAPAPAHAPYNHPPLSGAMLVFFNFLVDHGARFETLVRLPATLADFVTAIILFELIRTRRPAIEAAAGAVLFAWSPAMGIISGFHGNTDPVCIMFALLAVYLLVVRDSPALAGVSYAAGLSVKLVPIVVGPILLFIAWRAGGRHAARFVAGGAAVMAVLWGYALATEFASVRTNVIGYAGFGPKQWGISQFAQWLNLPEQFVDVYAGPGRFLVLLVSAGVPVLLAWRRPDLTLPAVGLTLALFLLLTPVHAMQYTVWPVAGLYLLGVWPATVYSLAGGLLLAKVYSRWSRGYPWNWDQAWANGMNPTEVKVAALVWVILLAVPVVSLWRPLTRPEPDETLASGGDADGTVVRPASADDGPGGDGMAASFPGTRNHQA